MNAKYGKASVWCFAVSIIVPVVVLLCLTIGLERMAFPVSYNTGLWWIWSKLISKLLMALGFLLGLVGLIKKESPKKYSIVGLGLNTVLIVYILVVNSGCFPDRTNEKHEKLVKRQAQYYLAMRNDMDNALCQSILVGKITTGMFPDEAIAAGGRCLYTMKTNDGSRIFDGLYIVGTMDIRFYFDYVKNVPSSPRTATDVLWTQRTDPMTNLIITMTFFNRTQFDTEDFVNTRVHFDAGRVSSIERLPCDAEPKESGDETTEDENE